MIALLIASIHYIRPVKRSFQNFILAMTLENIHWVIKNKPIEKFVFDNSSQATFQYKKDTLDETLAKDEVLLKTLYVSNDPAQRFWIYNPASKSYGGQVEPGSEVPARGLAQVLESNSDKYKKGDLIQGDVGWSKYSKLNVATTRSFKVDTDYYKVPLDFQFSVLGITSITAFVGLFRVAGLGAAKDTGKNYLITGAAGAVGSVAVQLASNVLKAKHVYAIAGGPEKVKYVESLAPNVIAVDYKDANFKENFKNALSGQEIDVYFDNVGGEILEYALDFVKVHGVVLYCGAISTYLDEKPRLFNILPKILFRRLTLKGFIVSDFAAEYELIRKTLYRYYQEKSLQSRATVVEDYQLAKLPEIWYRLFSGFNTGKLLTKVADA